MRLKDFNWQTLLPLMASNFDTQEVHLGAHHPSQETLYRQGVDAHQIPRPSPLPHQYADQHQTQTPQTPSQRQNEGGAIARGGRQGRQEERGDGER